MLALALLLLPPAMPLTVCDVMPELTRFDGKRVVISGVVHSNYHVFQLEGEDCKKHFVTKGYRWQAALMLVFTGGYLGHRLEGKPFDFGFVTNKDSLRLLEHARKRVKIDPYRRQMRAVVEGMILTGGSEYLVDNIYGPASTDGFGHGGQTPGVLVIKEIRMVEVFDSKHVPPVLTSQPH